MTRENLRQKVWYRLIKVIFILTFLLSMFMALNIASEVANTRHIKFEETYERIGEAVKRSYPQYNDLSNQTLGQKIMVEKDTNDKVRELWNSNNYQSLVLYEDSFSTFEKIKFYFYSIGIVLILFWALAKFFFYVVAGENY